MAFEEEEAAMQANMQAMQCMQMPMQCGPDGNNTARILPTVTPPPYPQLHGHKTSEDATEPSNSGFEFSR